MPIQAAADNLRRELAAAEDTPASGGGGGDRPGEHCAQQVTKEAVPAPAAAGSAGGALKEAGSSFAGSKSKAQAKKGAGSQVPPPAPPGRQAAHAHGSRRPLQAAFPVSAIRPHPGSLFPVAYQCQK